jgi:HEAT repeat protein
MLKPSSCLRAVMAVGVLALPLLGQSPTAMPGGWTDKPVMDVLEAVMSDDPAASAAASIELARRGPADIARTLTLGINLAALLPDAEAQTGVRTGRLVSALALLGAAAVPQLRVAVGHGGLDAVFATATLGEIGPVAAKSSAPILVSAFADVNDFVRVGAGDALVKVGPGAVPALLEGLANSNADLRWHSALTLGRLKAEPRRVVPALIAALHDADGNVREHATRALGTFGAQAQAAVPVLLDPTVGEELDEYEFAKALAAIAVSAPGELVKALKAGRPTASNRASVALGLLQPPAIDELITALASPSGHVRKVACHALIVAGPDGARAAPAVAGLLQDADAKVRSEALQMLSSLGPATDQIAAGVAARLADSDPDVRASAAQALGRVARGPQEMQPVLTLLADPQDEVRLAAAWALTDQPAGVTSIPVLLRALGDPNLPFAGVAAMAIGKLGQLGTPAKEAVPTLARLLESPDAALRIRAAAGLEGIGRAAAAATPRLVAALEREQSAQGKEAYLAALKAIGLQAKSALPAVERCTHDQDERVRSGAQETLVALRGH